MQKERPSDRNLTLFKDDKFLFNENQRPLAPSNLRGGANMQWGKGIARRFYPGRCSGLRVYWPFRPLVHRGE